MIEYYNEWKKDKEALFRLEDEIIKDKLADGIDGLEWLVLNTLLTIDREESFHDFAAYVNSKFFSIEKVIKDAVRLNPDTFHAKYKINWYIAIDEALTFLASVREKDYDVYFVFLDEIYNY